MPMKRCFFSFNYSVCDGTKRLFLLDRRSGLSYNVRFSLFKFETSNDFRGKTVTEECLDKKYKI